MRALVGSVAVHALLVWLIVRGDRDSASRAPHSLSASLTMTEAVEIDLLPLTDSDVGEPGGARAGGGPSSAAAREPRARRSRTVDADPRGAITIEHADPRGELPTDAADSGGALRIDGEGGLGFDGRGAGRGRGGTGQGTGIGFGDGGAIPRVDELAPPPAPRGESPSRARPARLIYPTRQRDVEDAELFVARVIVDDEGFVVGANLVRGFGGRRDEIAAQMIWRFRYAPALDDGGRPVRATLDQRFLVGP